jgi:glutamyl-tRNA synthetase
MGDVVTAHRHLDDPVIARADGTPLYNLAVAVDDLDAGITHVVRGSDHLANTPKQIVVIEALGGAMPAYAHLPLLHGPDGRKLSKRHGAASVQELRDKGYLPEAVRNYLALLGWGTEDDTTILSTPELIERFELRRVSRNPARFDEQKLRWLNGRYIRALDVSDLTQRVERFTGRKGLGPAVAIAQEKMQTLADFWPLVGPLVEGPLDDPRARERWLNQRGLEALADAREALRTTEPFDAESVERALREVVERRAAKPGDVFQPLRVALTGTTVSPGIFESVALLGRDETLARIDATLNGHARSRSQ